MRIDDFRKYIDDELRKRQGSLTAFQRSRIVEQFESEEFLNRDSLERMPENEVKVQIDSILEKITSTRLFSESIQLIETRAREELRAAHCKFPPFCRRGYNGLTNR